MKYHASISKKPSGYSKFGVPLFKVTVANKSVMASKATYAEIQKRLKNMNRLKSEEERFRRMGDLLGAMDSPETIAKYAKTSRMMTNMFKKEGIQFQHFKNLKKMYPNEFYEGSELYNKLTEIYKIMRSMTQYEFQRFYDEGENSLDEMANFYELTKADPLNRDPEKLKEKIDELYEKVLPYKK